MRVRAAPPGVGVPNTEALRLAALQASWLRDRRVGRRRLTWRWTVWLALRVVLPVLALAGVLFIGWLLMQHLRAEVEPGFHQAAPASAPALAASAGDAPLELPVLPAPALRLDLGLAASDSANRSGAVVDKTDVIDPPADSRLKNLKPSTSGDIRP